MRTAFAARPGNACFKSGFDAAGSRDFVFKFFQRAPDQRAHHARRQAFRQRMNRHDAVDVDEFVVARLDQFGFGMVNVARLERIRFAENQKLAPDRDTNPPSTAAPATSGNAAAPCRRQTRIQTSRARPC